jgi:hypothetical protein
MNYFSCRGLRRVVGCLLCKPKTSGMIGHRIKLARSKAGWSLRELSWAMDRRVTAQAIGKYERGEDVPSAGCVFRPLRSHIPIHCDRAFRFIAIALSDAIDHPSGGQLKDGSCIRLMLPLVLLPAGPGVDPGLPRSELILAKTPSVPYSTERRPPPCTDGHPHDPGGPAGFPGETSGAVPGRRP